MECDVNKLNKLLDSKVSLPFLDFRASNRSQMQYQSHNWVENVAF